MGNVLQPNTGQHVESVLAVTFDVEPFPAETATSINSLQRTTRQRLQEGLARGDTRFVRPIRFPAIAMGIDGIPDGQELDVITQESRQIFQEMADSTNGHLRVASHRFGLAPIAPETRDYSLGEIPSSVKLAKSIIPDGYTLAAEVEIVWGARDIQTLRMIRDWRAARSARIALGAARRIKRKRKLEDRPYWSDAKPSQFVYDPAKQQVVLVDIEPLLRSKAPDYGCPTRW